MFTRVVVVLSVIAALGVPVLAQQREGITVRGHWLFEVFNRDGSLAQRRELENALVEGGAVLAQLLARQESFGHWLVLLHTAQAGPFNNVAGIGSGAVLVETAVGQIVPEVFPTLSVTPNGGSLVLKGRATAVRAGAINEVHTLATSCAAAAVAGSCPVNGAVSMKPFSGKPLSPPLALEAEQDIQVTVTISFSSPQS